MGTLKPGATYIYERANGVTYAREAGSQPGDRVAIGWDHETRGTLEQLKEDKLWGEIRRAAKTNPALQDALERAIVIHELSKQPPPDPDTIMWHPV